MARTVFGVMMAVLLAVAGLPLGLSLAQVTPTVQIVNPGAHGGTPPVIADKEQPFHVNSWVNFVPPQPLVEFELDRYRNPPPYINDPIYVETRTVGSATQTGPNSFDLHWDIPNDIADTHVGVIPPDGQDEITYKLRAILYTGFTGPGTGSEVSRDEMDVTITKGAETMEITYPANGGQAGVYIKPDGSGGNFIIEGIGSSGVTAATALYTRSAPGEEPTWTTCPGAATVTAQQNGPKLIRHRCDIAAGHYALGITGVALRSTTSNGADAHVVDPYFQRVGQVAIEPATLSEAAITACPKFVVTVLDQNDRPIGAMNVDMHAQGPSDQLRFNTSYPAPAPRTQPPDASHSTPESAQACTSDDAKGNLGGQQGVHKLPGVADVKHIETAFGATAGNNNRGTDAQGKFTFGLTADKAGATQMTAFADEDDDDQFCSEEKSANGSIGWNQGAPSPAGLPAEETTCPVTTPSPTPSASASTSPSGSVSESPSSSPPPSTHSREITIGFEHGSLIVSGRVTVPDGTNKCRANVPVKVQRKKDGKFRTKKTVTTNGAGFYSATLRDRRGTYRAVAPQVTVDEDVCLKKAAKKRHRHKR